MQLPQKWRAPVQSTVLNVQYSIGPNYVWQATAVGMGYWENYSLQQVIFCGTSLKGYRVTQYTAVGCRSTYRVHNPVELAIVVPHGGTIQALMWLPKDDITSCWGAR
jgi:hypothetical protein